MESQKGMDVDLKIALVQSDIIWEDNLRNLEIFAGELERIREPADLVLLPEMFSTGFSVNPEKCAETMDGPSVRFLKEHSSEMNCVITGSLLIRDKDQYFNRLVAMFPDGSLFHYDKRHLFRLSEEYKVISRGNKKVIVTVKGWKILPLVCYDLRFPVWSMNTYLNGEYEYDLLVYVANWPESRRHVWKSLLTARAIENQAYAAGVNRIGKDGQGTGHCGESLVSDPKGEILASAGQDASSTLLITLEKERLDRHRESFQIGPDWDRFTLDNT
jgi:predicted amidohydrolase